MKIYLADLTHETITISSDTMPLNVGFLGAYLKKQLGQEVNVELFKSPGELIEKIKEQVPDILGLSNYCWNFELSYFLCEYVKGINPKVLTVMGGANFPKTLGEQDLFLRQHGKIDFYVYQEGELSFCDLVKKSMVNGLDIGKTKQEAIQGCLHLSPEGILLNGGLYPRIRGLNELPSPYLSGVMDKFFGTKLNPFIQTNRGCPFTCTFCHEGEKYYSAVNSFPLDRIGEELDYIGHHVRGQTVLMIADSNFGMYQQDVEICKKIRRIQETKKYPGNISVTTGKNKPDLILKSIETLQKGTISMTASVQSLDPAVLGNIQRKNIEWQTYIDIQKRLHQLDAGYSSRSEVILALPGESKESHFETIRKLIDAGVDRILVYTLMMLYGTYLNSPAEREKYGYVTRFRLIPRGFGEYEGHRCMEVEEVGVANKDMSFEDYKLCRKMSLLLTLVYNNKSFKELFKYLKDNGAEIYPFLLYCFEHAGQADESILKVFADFMRETEEELWESRGALLDHFNREEAFTQLLKEDGGGNLLQKYWVKGVIFNFASLTNFIFDCAVGFLAKKETDCELENIKKYTLLKRNNLFNVENAGDEVFVELDYDLEGWLQDGEGKRLEDFKGKKTFVVSTSEAQRELLKNLLKQYGSGIQAIGKISTRVNVMSFERRFHP